MDNLIPIVDFTFVGRFLILRRTKHLENNNYFYNEYELIKNLTG